MQKLFLAAVTGALAFLVVSAPCAAAHAQTPQGTAGVRTMNGASDDMMRQRMERLRRENQDISPEETTGPSVNAAAQQAAGSAGVGCRVTQAVLLGQTTQGERTYEAACAAGPGYILINSTPARALDCVVLAGQAEADRAIDPNADVGAQCAILQNQDAARVIAAYASEAGIACTVDQGVALGRTAQDGQIYEVGCEGVDGYRIEQAGSGWRKTECAVVLTQNATCRYSTDAERAATLKSRLTGSEAAACDVSQGRYMGASAGDAFYEAKCAGGNGYVVRFTPEFAVRQIFPCEVAQGIGGGCRLTTVATAPAAQ